MGARGSKYFNRDQCDRTLQIFEEIKGLNESGSEAKVLNGAKTCKDIHKKSGNTDQAILPQVKDEITKVGGKCNDGDYAFCYTAKRKPTFLQEGQACDQLALGTKSAVLDTVYELDTVACI